MRIGWLVWHNEEDKYPVLQEYEPDCCFYKAVQIVYEEVQEGYPEPSIIREGCRRSYGRNITNNSRRRRR